MKIYTKFGDRGKTRLYGGETVSKTHLRIEAYGTIDELCSILGIIVAEMKEYIELKELVVECENIQQQLFDCGSDSSTPNELRKYKQEEKDIFYIENKIDEYIPILPKLEHFIIPGGHKISGMIHQARTVTRRTERRIVSLMEENEKINEIGLRYINRLSDYFFVLARLVNFKMNVKDTVYSRSSKVFKSSK